MHKATRLQMTDLNPHLLCVLCGGYLIDATTIIECLHSFCRTCIVRYLGSSKYCPICDVQVHKTKPHLNLRPDKALQSIVYKLVPGLFKAEMKRRREFYTENPNAEPSPTAPNASEARGVVDEERSVCIYDENISLSLHHCKRWPIQKSQNENSATKDSNADVRYLLCPAALQVCHLKKYVRMKFGLPHYYKIDIFYSDEALGDDYSLMDITHTYAWRRIEPLKLYYIVYCNSQHMETMEVASGGEIRDNVKGADPGSEDVHVLPQASTINKTKENKPHVTRTIDLNGPTPCPSVDHMYCAEAKTTQVPAEHNIETNCAVESGTRKVIETGHDLEAATLSRDSTTPDKTINGGLDTTADSCPQEVHSAVGTIQSTNDMKKEDRIPQPNSTIDVICSSQTSKITCFDSQNKPATPTLHSLQQESVKVTTIKKEKGLIPESKKHTSSPSKRAGDKTQSHSRHSRARNETPALVRIINSICEKLMQKKVEKQNQAAAHAVTLTTPVKKRGRKRKSPIDGKGMDKGEPDSSVKRGPTPVTNNNTLVQLLNSNSPQKRPAMKTCYAKDERGPSLVKRVKFDSEDDPYAFHSGELVEGMAGLTVSCAKSPSGSPAWKKTVPIYSGRIHFKSKIFSGQNAKHIVQSNTAANLNSTGCLKGVTENTTRTATPTSLGTLNRVRNKVIWNRNGAADYFEKHCDVMKYSKSLPLLANGYDKPLELTKRKSGRPSKDNSLKPLPLLVSKKC